MKGTAFYRTPVNAIREDKKKQPEDYMAAMEKRASGTSDSDLLHTSAVVVTAASPAIAEEVVEVEVEEVDDDMVEYERIKSLRRKRGTLKKK